MLDFNWDLLFSGLEAFATLIGALLIIKQIALTRESNEKNELVKRKEVTLNAYNTMSDTLKSYNNELQSKFGIQEYHDHLTEEDLKNLLQDAEFTKHIQLIYDYLGRLAIGVKNEIYDFDIIVDVPGRWLVRLYDRYEIYIHYLRELDSPKVYTETEEFIDKVRKKFVDDGEVNLIKKTTSQKTSISLEGVQT